MAGKGLEPVRGANAAPLDRRAPGLYTTERLEWAETLSLEEARSRAPSDERRSIEMAAGSPLFTWYASASDRHWLYLAVGPAGFCNRGSVYDEGRWVPIREQHSVAAEHSRWFGETALPASAAGRRERVGRGAPSRALAGVDRNFAQGFGMLPEQTQRFFREPFEDDPATDGDAYWYSEWNDGVVTFYVWAFAVTTKSVAFAYATRSAAASREAFAYQYGAAALQHVPLNVRATWWKEPEVPKNLSTSYSILGVPRHASDAEIRSSYRILAREYHPDTAHGSPADNAVRFDRVQKAWDTLSSSAARAEYDRMLKETRSVPQSIGWTGWWDSPSGRGRG